MDKLDLILLKIGYFVCSIASILIACLVLVDVYRLGYFEWCGESRLCIEALTILFCSFTFFFAIKSILSEDFGAKNQELTRTLEVLFVSCVLLFFFGWAYFLFVGNNELLSASKAYFPFLCWLVQLFLVRCLNGYRCKSS